jgi:hypothetical protein
MLRNRTCHCPFFKINQLCLRRRYQTTINGTLDSLVQTSRHLLSSGPLLLTVDASNEEAMLALAASLQGVRSVGTVVTRVVDAMDTLVGGDASATLEIANATVDTTGNTLSLVVDCRFPLADYFYLYMHLGASAPVCPPFDTSNRCCRGDMSSDEFWVADNVDCTSSDPIPALDRFVQVWNGEYLSQDKQLIRLTVDLSQPYVPSTIEAGARAFRLGVGMVVFGKLAQNTEARVELVLNSSSVATSFGAFQYSCVQYSRLQLESCGNATFAHLIVKAAGVEAVQNIRFQSWDGGEWRAPNCTGNQTSMGVFRLNPCNISIGPDLVDIWMSMEGIPVNSTTTVYVLLLRGSVLTRVVAKTDNTTINHCHAPIVVNAVGSNAFTIEVKQGSVVKYSGPLQFVQLTDVAALTVRLISGSPLYTYAFDNISVVYSLIDSSKILSLMPNGRPSPELEKICEQGHVCLIEELLLQGVCQTGEKCEVQGDSLFLMPLFPWGSATMKNGTYTVLVAEIKETFIQPAAKLNGTSLMRRLFSWMAI